MATHPDWNSSLGAMFPHRHHLVYLEFSPWHSRLTGTQRSVLHVSNPPLLPTPTVPTPPPFSPFSPTLLSPSCQPAVEILLEFILLAASISMETSRCHGNYFNRAKRVQKCCTRPLTRLFLFLVLFLPSPFSPLHYYLFSCVYSTSDECVFMCVCDALMV